MVEKYFLALDFDTEKIESIGNNALDVLENEFGSDFVRRKLGVKLNDYALRGDFSSYAVFNERCEIFADIKIFHGAGTGYKIIEEVTKRLPINYVTVSSYLGERILSEYVKRANRDGIKIIAFTAHTKIDASEIEAIHNAEANEVIYKLAKIAYNADCDAVVLDVSALRDKRIEKLPIKKLVTGIRIEADTKGEQARVSFLNDVLKLKEKIHYVVISSRYVQNPQKMVEIVRKLE